MKNLWDAKDMVCDIEFVYEGGSLPDCSDEYFFVVQSKKKR